MVHEEPSQNEDLAIVNEEQFSQNEDLSKVSRKNENLSELNQFKETEVVESDWPE